MRALACCLLVACSVTPDRAPELATVAELAADAIESRSTEHDHVPPEPVTLSGLVADGRHARIVTPRGPIHVWVPAKYRPRRADTIVYVHGYYTNVDGAWRQHNLPLQFAASAINAMFIACEAPSAKGQPVAWPSLGALLDTVHAGIGERRAQRRVVAIGHSGAYRTLARWLDDPLLDTVILLDATYGEIEEFRDWVLADRKHRLINVGDDSTRKWADELHRALPQTVVLDGFPPLDVDLPRAKVLYIRTSLGHFPIITDGIVIPMVLRTLRARKLLDTPLSELLDR